MDNPPHHNNSLPPSTFLELKEDHQTYYSTLSLSCPAFMNPTQDQGDFYYREPKRFQLREVYIHINFILSNFFHLCTYYIYYIYFLLI